MKALLDGKIDATLGFISLQYLRAKFFSETRMYTSLTMALIIPLGAEFGNFEKFTRPFTDEVWMIILVVFASACLVSFVAIIESGRFSDFLVGEGIKYPIYNVFAVFFGIPQNILPRRNFARYILMCFLIYSLVIRSVYQGAVYQTLKSNDRKPPISTIREFIDRKFTFYIYESLAPRLVDFEFYPLRVVFPNKEIHEKRLMTLNPSFKGVFFNNLPQILYNNQLNYKNYTFTVCKESFYNMPFVFYFKKNHFLVDEINEKLDLLLMNGMINHFTKKYADPGFLRIKKNGERKVLTLTHFRGAFMFYFLLLQISIISFIAEIISNSKCINYIQRKFLTLFCRK